MKGNKIWRLERLQLPRPLPTKKHPPPAERPPNPKQPSPQPPQESSIIWKIRLLSIWKIGIFWSRKLTNWRISSWGALCRSSSPKEAQQMDQRTMIIRSLNLTCMSCLIRNVRNCIITSKCASNKMKRMCKRRRTSAIWTSKFRWWWKIIRGMFAWWWTNLWATTRQAETKTPRTARPSSSHSTLRVSTHKMPMSLCRMPPLCRTISSWTQEPTLKTPKWNLNRMVKMILEISK